MRPIKMRAIIRREKRTNSPELSVERVVLKVEFVKFMVAP